MVGGSADKFKDSINKICVTEGLSGMENKY